MVRGGPGWTVALPCPTTHAGSPQINTVPLRTFREPTRIPPNRPNFCPGRWCNWRLKPKSHQSRTKHGPSRITQEHPGPRDASIRGEPGWKCFDGPSMAEKHRHPGPSRTRHGSTMALWMNTEPTRMPPDHHGSTMDRPRTIPDHPGRATNCPGPPRTVPDQKHFCINRVAFFVSFSF